MRQLIVPLCLCASSMAAHAQVNRQRPGPRQPGAWISAGVEYQQGWTVDDGASGTRWDFAKATRFGASLEKAVASGVTLGVRASTANVPVRVMAFDVIQDENANVTQTFVTLHMTSGRSIHSVVELSGGATFYSNFAGRTGARSLAPGGIDPDFAYSLGYGVGLSVSPAFAIDVIRDATTSVHRGDGLADGVATRARVSGTRVVGRIGIGG